MPLSGPLPGGSEEGSASSFILIFGRTHVPEVVGLGPHLDGWMMDGWITDDGWKGDGWMMGGWMMMGG